MSLCPFQLTGTLSPAGKFSCTGIFGWLAEYDRAYASGVNDRRGEIIFERQRALR